MALYVGLMSGTSADAVDAALVDLDGDRVQVLGFHQEPIPPELRELLAGTHRPDVSMTLAQYGFLHRRFGRLFAAAANQVLENTGIDASRVIAIGSHGQTVLHQVGGEERFSLQVGDPSTIANLTGIQTVADFRGADIAVGGEGAPLAPAFHQAHFRTPRAERVILNIGGIANVTVLPKDQALTVTGFDTGPGNALLDQWALRHLGLRWDQDGHWASQGAVDQELLERLKSEPYFKRPPPKSTGREHFNIEWLLAALGQVPRSLGPQDVQATLLQCTVETIAEAIHRYAPEAEEVLVCGGGACNSLLLRCLRGCLPQCRVDTTEHEGLDPRRVEAVAFAWLAKRRLAVLPGNLPSVTGAARPAILGAVYAGTL